MTLLFGKNFFGWTLFLGLAFLLAGCNQDEAAKVVKDTEESLKDTGEAVAAEADKAVKKGEEIAGELGEKAMAWLAPLKEKFGDLDSLKQSPEKLKTAVGELIQSIEKKAEGVKLPESVSKALSSIKEKLVALEKYLEGEVEQAKIDEHVAAVVDSVKSGLGFSDK